MLLITPIFIVFALRHYAMPPCCLTLLRLRHDVTLTPPLRIFIRLLHHFSPLLLICPPPLIFFTYSYATPFDAAADTLPLFIAATPLLFIDYMRMRCQERHMLRHAFDAA